MMSILFSWSYNTFFLVVVPAYAVVRLKCTLELFAADTFDAFLTFVTLLRKMVVPTYTARARGRAG